MSDDAPKGKKSLPKTAPEPEVAPAPKQSKTPLFEAIHSARYQRRDLIEKIEQESGSKLICYVAGFRAPVDREDVVCFVDLLHNLPAGRDTDLLLQTGGGDIDAAEKLITMVRKRVGTARLRVIVPDYAKSAGTLMALGADAIMMSDTSELGPVDPQVSRTDHNGNVMWHSVKNYIDAYEEHRRVLAKDPGNVTAQMMLNKLDPETVQLFTSIMARARSFAEGQLKRGMMQQAGNWSKAVSALIDTTRFQTHGQPISWEDAADPEIGLEIEYRAPEDPLWALYWQLYCLQILAVKDNQKLFESDYASLCIDSRAV